MRVEDSSHTFGVRHDGDVGPIEFGSYAPGILDRSVIALTSRMPLNWLGLRLAILLRRLSTMRLEHPAGALDVMRWGMRLRLHPIDNGCEKNSAVHTADVRDNRACGVVRGNFPGKGVEAQV